MSTAHLLPTYARVDLAFERGEGAWLDRHQRRALSRLHLRRRGQRARPCASAAGRSADRAGRTSSGTSPTSYRIPEQREAGRPAVRGELRRLRLLRQFRRRGDGMRDQDRAQVSRRRAASPSAIASSPSRARSTAARWRRSRPAARRNISKASGRWSTASTRCRSAISRRSRSAIGAGDRRDPDRADPGRGRRARCRRSSSSRRCASSATSTACC